MSDLTGMGDEALSAGLAAGYGALAAPVLMAIERATGTHVPRVTLRGPGTAGVAPVARGSSDSQAAPQTGRANYQVHGEIARGGMGLLLKCRDVDLGREVALKVLRSELADRPEFVQRFLEEAQIAGQLQHPGIVPVYELGLMNDTRPYFAMKLVQGRTLAALLTSRSPGERRELLDVFASVCQTVAYAHSRGVVHRDLKPSNVLLGDFGEVQVIDWGLAKVLVTWGATDTTNETPEKLPKRSTSAAPERVRTSTSTGASHSITGSVMGTPAYMSPEQALGKTEELDERSDVFALGAILCEILTGDPPYRGASKLALAQAAAGELDDARARLGACAADAALVDLCNQCLTADAALRPQTAEVLAERVRAYLASLSERARRAEVTAAEARVRVRSTVLLSSIVAVLVLVSTGVWVTWRENRAQEVRAIERSVDAALAEAGSAAEHENWSLAATALGRARARSESPFASEALRATVATRSVELEEHARQAREREALTRDNELWLAELESVRQPEGDAIYPTDWAALDAIHTSSFEAHGVRVDSPSSDAPKESLLARGISVELGAVLDEWTRVRRLAGSEPGALRLMQLATQIDPDPLRQELRDAWAERDDAALAAIAERAQTEHLPPRSLRLLARDLRYGGSPKVAIELLQAGCRRHPDDYALQFELGRALRHSTPPRINEALACYRTAVALRPQNVEAWHELGMTLYPLAGRAEEAIELFREVVQRFPNDGHMYFHLGTAQTSLRRDAEALANLQLAVELEPEFALGHSNLGLTLDRLGRTQEALACYERALELDALHVGTNHNYGIALRVVGRMDEAIVQFERASELDSQFSPAHTELAYIYFTRNDFEPGISHARRSLELEPKNSYVNYILGRCLLGSEQSGEARVAFEESLRLNPNYLPSHQELVLLLLLTASSDARDATLALEHAREAVRLAPGKANDAALLSIALYAGGAFQEARAAFEAIQDADEEDPLVELFLGLCDLHLEQPAEARHRLAALDLESLGSSALIANFVHEAQAFLADGR